MTDILSSFSVLITFFLLIVVGYVGKKVKAFDDGTIKGGTDLLMMVGIPGAIFSSSESVSFQGDTIRNALLVFFLYALWFLVMILIMHQFSQLPVIPRESRKAFIGNAVFKNIAFMGIPLCSAVLGEQSVFYVAICMVVFNLLHWSYGVFLYSGGRRIDFRTMIVNMPIITVLSMLLLKITGLKLPQILWDTFSAAGSICTPISLVIMGIMLAGDNLKALVVDKVLYLASVATLVISPVVALATILLFRPPQSIGAVLILLSLTPSASMNAVLARKYGGDGAYVSLMVLQTLLLSLITIPVLAMTVFRSFF